MSGSRFVDVVPGVPMGATGGRRGAGSQGPPLAVALAIAVVVVGLGVWLLLPVEGRGDLVGSRWRRVSSGAAMPWILIVLGVSAAASMFAGRAGARIAALLLFLSGVLVMAPGFTSGDLWYALYSGRYPPPPEVLIACAALCVFGASLVLGGSLPPKVLRHASTLSLLGAVALAGALWTTAAARDIEGPAAILPGVLGLLALTTAMGALTVGGYRLGRSWLEDRDRMPVG